LLISLTALAASVDDDFLAAREAYRTGQAPSSRIRQAVEGYVLEPYVAYWQLNLRLEQRTARELRAFLATYRDTRCADRVRSDWVKMLGRSQQWSLFEEELPLVAGETSTFTCYSLQSRMRLNPNGAAARGARPVVRGRDMPESCTPLFDALVANGMLYGDRPVDAHTARSRNRPSGRVRRVSSYLPAAQAPDLKALEDLVESSGYLEQKKLDYKLRAGRETVMFRGAPARAHFAAAGGELLDEARGELRGRGPGIRVGHDRLPGRHAARCRCS
jgi:soluble lytic murein transglycosylase